MRYLWRTVNRLCPENTRTGAFLAIHIVFWTVGVLIIGLLFCVAAGGVQVADCIANVMCMAAYAGIIFGLFGGLFYLMREVN